MDLRNINARWRYRRRIAVISFIEILVAPIIYTLLSNQYPHIQDVLSLFANIQYICGGIVMSYFGFATFDDIKNNEEK